MISVIEFRHGKSMVARVPLVPLENSENNAVNIENPRNLFAKPTPFPGFCYECHYLLGGRKRYLPIVWGTWPFIVSRFLAFINVNADDDNDNYSWRALPTIVATLASSCRKSIPVVTGSGVVVCARRYDIIIPVTLVEDTSHDDVVVKVYYAEIPARLANSSSTSSIRSADVTPYWVDSSVSISTNGVVFAWVGKNFAASLVVANKPVSYLAVTIAGRLGSKVRHYSMKGESFAPSIDHMSGELLPAWLVVVELLDV